jgi:uncharacterized membrane protein YtjA (UPF0391 family)
MTPAAAAARMWLLLWLVLFLVLLIAGLCQLHGQRCLQCSSR